MSQGQKCNNMKNLIITAIEPKDMRWPTSLQADGSDAMVKENDKFI